MKKTKYLKSLPRLIAIALNGLLFIAVIFLMNYVQNLLYSDVQINLTEIVTQNKDVISSKLKLELNNLDLVANQLSERMVLKGTSAGENSERFNEVFQEYCAANTNVGEKIFIADKNGKALFSDSSTLEVSGRKYFRLAIEGIPNISDRVVSRLNGNEIFIISVPVTYQGGIIGTVQKQYTPDEMYNLCSLSLFSSQGSMYVINSEGYILISSENEEYNQESVSYVRTLYAQGNQEASKKLEDDIKNDNSGFMETIQNGKKIFSAYTPIEELHDWYLISSIATDAVSPNANIVVRMFYFILLVIVIIVGTSLFLFLWYKNKQQANLEHIAFVDTVTQGNTYNKFMVDLHETLQKNPEKQYYLLSFDIDNFKYVNNYYGFDLGDRILFHIYENIGKMLLPSETIARVSGDHFVVLLENVEQERLDCILEQMEEEGVTVHFSAGLYRIDNPEESVNLMLDKASTAAQSSKGVFHKRVELYSEKFDQLMIYNEQMKRSVEQALAGDEMIPYFQPKVNVLNGKLVGAEALARWLTKEGKLIPPNEFIPICEKTGLIVELDMMIFEKTLRFLRKNLDAGRQCVPISVNFSRLHLPNRNFLSLVLEKLQEYRIPPNLIEIELTESVIFDNFELIEKFAQSLREAGLLIAMDDFGSGYSSLNLLKDIPIDVLKIDRGFLKETSNADKQRIILSTIAKMAEQLHINVVVEGVETKENVEMMKEFGCTVAQGYYFAKPMDETAFQVIYEEGSL